MNLQNTVNEITKEAINDLIREGNLREKDVAEFEFAITLTTEIRAAQLQEQPSSYLLSRIVAATLKMGKRHSRLQETACNRELSVSEKKEEERLEGKMADLMGLFGIKVKLGGDPRGCTVKLLLPSGRTNDFASEGYCVPGA
jgi:hypothetical protein